MDFSHELIRQDSTFWSLRQLLYLLRGEKFLAVVHFIYFLRIMQKLSNILHPSRQNWTTEDWFFLQKEVNSIKYLSQLLSHLLLYPGLSQWKLLSSPYIIHPWLFQTHPPTKSGKFQIFFLIEPFPKMLIFDIIFTCFRCLGG